jgi:hypothetical protein
LRGNGRTIYVDRKVVLQYRWRKAATCYKFSGVGGLVGYFPLESILRIMEGVA